MYDDGVGYCLLKVWAVCACKCHHTGYLASIAASIGAFWAYEMNMSGLSLSAIASAEEERERQSQILFDMSWGLRVESGESRVMGGEKQSHNISSRWMVSVRSPPLY